MTVLARRAVLFIFLMRSVVPDDKVKLLVVVTEHGNTLRPSCIALSQTTDFYKLALLFIVVC